MKAKKLTVVSVTLVILSSVISLLYGFLKPDLPELVAGTQKSYRILFGLKCFFTALPAVVSTAYIIGWAADFGENSGGSRIRFSSAMFERYKKILITSIATIAVLICSQEIIQPDIERKLHAYEELPERLSEYKRFSNALYGHGRYELSYSYAKLAAEIDEKDAEAIRLLNEAAIALNEMEAVNTPESDAAILEHEIKDALSAQSASEKGAESSAKNQDSESLFTTYRLLQLAQEKFAQKDWFGAHYHAQLALSAAPPADVNTAALRQIAAESWNNLSEIQAKGATESQQIFARKYKGYSALLENDNLQAYYIFKALSQQSRSLAIDPDVKTYLAIAEGRLKERYFFTDETFNLRNFETAHDVHFKIRKKDGSTDLFVISGITNSGTGDGFVQYLRGLHIFSIDSDGEYIGGTFTPYAKMSAVSASHFTDDARLQLGIEKNMKYVPFVLLRAVDRNAPAFDGEPAIPPLSADGMPIAKNIQQNSDGYLILPMEFSDFALIQEATGQTKNMRIVSLFNFISKARQYGYAEEVFAQAFLNRIFYPLFMLILLICIACMAWNGRTPKNSLFKLKWIVLFPIFCAVFISIYKVTIDFFSLLNYGILYSVGTALMIPAGLAVYLLLLFLVSLGFLACKDSSKE